MTTTPYKTLLMLSLIIGVFGNSPAWGKVIDDGPQSLSQISSIAESLRNAGQRPLHILYVHGMGATDSQASWTFQKHICALLKGCKLPKDPAPVGTDYADSGVFADGAEPPAFEYMGARVWTNAQEWQASRPFVVHYVLRRSDGGPVVVDEINWWPLVLPLKCHAIMAGEARLAGPDASRLDFCKKQSWISAADAQALKSIRPKGALFNRTLKSSILDWGMSDAMMAVGSLHDIFREGMRQLFVKSARFRADGSKSSEWEQQFAHPHGMDREFIVVSHSLGSYLVFSTLNMDQHNDELQNQPDQPDHPKTDAERREDAAARYILERTSLVYFFANQIPLLELAHMEGSQVPGSKEQQAATPRVTPREALSQRMTRWKELRQNFRKRRGGAEEPPERPPQVVAFSDPSDLLTWRVPEIKALVVTNLYIRNSWWHWLIAGPLTAHSNYASNKDVLKIMMESKASGSPK